MAEIILSKFPGIGHHRLNQTSLTRVSPDVVAGWRAKRTSEDLRIISEEYMIPVHRLNRVFHELKGTHEVISALTTYFNNKP